MTWAGELVGTIYDAAEDPALWEDVMTRLVRRTNARSGIFYDHDHAARHAKVLGAIGFDPYYVRQYEDYYAALDPWHKRGEGRPLGEVAQTAGMLSDVELKRTEFYQDHLRPQGVFYAMGGPVMRAGTRMAVFGIQSTYQTGVFTAETESLIRRLMPHFRRAYRMQGALDAVRREGMEFEAVLHLLPQPVLVVDRDGHLLFANAAGEQLLRAGTMLRVAAGRIRPAHRGDIAAFAKALNPIADGADGDGSLALRRAGERRPVMVRVTPLRRRNRAEWSGRIALMVELPPAPRGLDTWAVAFRLSPAETRLWAALSAGRRLIDIAEESGVSINTVRVQLRTLFQKTGVHRQADLLRLAIEVRDGSSGNSEA
jgi:DNA-binding CsgD family transcriptional regulator/PAS domain-containing protein